MKLRAIAILALVLLTAATLSAQQAVIQEEKQIIKTYPFYGGDPAPIMTRSSMWGRGQKLYPYYFIDGMSVEGKDQPWNVVRLENPFVRLFVLPAEGGKLIGAIEKSTDNTFIYYNQVRKFRQIALRGPWTSGGIEFNFGIRGHQATTATPVDYAIRTNPDGSVSCVVGIMDLPSRTHWSVAITLPKDKAYFETRSLFYNPTPLNQAYYVWMNAANRVGDDLQFIFPGTGFIGHDYGAAERPWPVAADGRDLSWYKNHDYEGAPGSLFIFGKRIESVGAYWNDAQFGFGHWSHYDDMPGHKFFHWSLAPSGMIWKTLLTDTNGQYFEPQMGRLFTQEDHEFLAPYGSDQWREIWFPYKKIGPMVEATPYGALNVKNDGGSLSLGFCALQALDEEIVVTAAGREVHRERLILKTMEVWQKTLPLKVQAGTLQVRVGDKLTYADDPKANLIERPINFRLFDESTVEGTFQAAERLHKSRDYDQALAKYKAVLDKEPLHVRALVRTAEIHAWRGEYEAGLGFVRKALDFTMYDPAANYVYGVLARKFGKTIDALETLGWAARSMEFRSAAFGQMAEIYLGQNRLDLALEYTRRSLEYNVSNIKTLQVQAAVRRLRNEAGEADKILDKLLELDPLNHIARFERHLLRSNPADLKAFQEMIRNEMPHETYLETALFYVSLGRAGDALKALAAGPEHPTLLYWSAYLLKDSDPARSKTLLAKAASLSPYLVFPFREECIPVYAWAKTALPDSWKAGYYLGLIYWGKTRPAEALREMSALGERPDYAPFYVTRGYLEKAGEPSKTAADFEKALAIDAKDWRNWHHLIALHGESGRHDKALELAQKAAKLFPSESVITVDLARSFLNNGRYQDSVAVLAKAIILPYEGQRDVHALFVNGLVCAALADMKAGRYAPAVKKLEEAKNYPERLGTGRPYNPDFRVQDTLQRLCYEKMKNAKLADEARKRVREYKGRGTQESPEAVEAKVEQWFKTLGTQDERKALEELLRIFGPRGQIRD